VIRLGDIPAITTDNSDDTQLVWGWHRGYYGGYRGYYGGYYGGYRGYASYYRPYYGYGYGSYRPYYNYYRPYYSYSYYRPYYYGGYGYGGYGGYYQPYYNYTYSQPYYYPMSISDNGSGSYCDYSLAERKAPYGGSVGSYVLPAPTTKRVEPMGKADVYVQPPPRPEEGTFPYDGGPGKPVPMPKIDQPQKIAPIDPSQGRIASVPTQAPKYTYRAYGEKDAPTVLIKDDSSKSARR
jgi:hypothetical protein